MAIRPGVAPYDALSYSVGQGTGANASNYIPEIFSKKMLKDFYASTIFSEISNTDYEGEIKKAGDKIYIRVVPTISIGTYVVGGDAVGSATPSIKYEVPTEDHRSLIIDQAKYWAFKMDYIDEMQTDLPLISEFSSNAAEQMKIAVDKEVLEYITGTGKQDADNVGADAGAISGDINMGADANGSGRLVNSVDNDADNILAVIVDMNAVLDENNIPSEGRWCALPASICALLKKGDLRRADITGDSTGVIRTGLIGMVDRMKIYQTNQLPKATTETEAFLCPFGTNEAVTFAAQITQTESLPIVESFGTYWRGLFVYGREVIQPKALGLAVLKTKDVV